MSRLGKPVGAILRRGHIDEHRLDEIARSGEPISSATTGELAHLRACSRCGGLLTGYRRAVAVLEGAWADRPLNRGIAIRDGVDRARLTRPGAGRPGHRGAIPLAAAAVLVALVATAGLLGLRGGGQPTASGAQPTASGVAARTEQPSTPLGTGVVARLPIEQYSAFSWAPDGAHVLVSGESASRVYDRSGKLVASFGPGEGWLDASHLIDGDGHVYALTDRFQPKTDAYPWYGWVVANGHGSAAIIVAVPACVGDPMVDWYSDGRYMRAGEKVTPFGWSPDGRLVLKGHMDCSSVEGELQGWKGPVDVVDFATGRVVATAPQVRGEVAFNPNATRLATQSDADLEVLDLAGGHVATVPGLRFLGWLDDDHLYAVKGATVEVVDASAVGSLSPIASGEWQVLSSAGPRVVADTTGAARRIVAADGTTTLLDLTSSGLETEHVSPAGSPVGSGLQRRWWSPDGRMLALESADGASLVLMSVDPTRPGSVGSALPTPVGFPKALKEVDRTELPGPVADLVSDRKGNSLWFLSGSAGAPIDLYRYDIATGALTKRPLDGTTYDAERSCLAVAPTGAIWIGAGSSIVVYDPATKAQSRVTLPATGADVQADPATGKADPWVSGIAFDGPGNAIIARNWVRSLSVVDPSLRLLDSRIDISDGFSMTGDLAVAGGRIFIVADPKSGLAFGADPAQGRAGTKASASRLVGVGDRALTAGSPPGWLLADGSGGAMVEPVMSSADLVASGPNGTAALYSSELGEAQWRDTDGHVSGQAVFGTGAAPKVSAIALDSQGRLWAVEAVGSGSCLVRLEPTP